MNAHTSDSSCLRIPPQSVDAEQSVLGGVMLAGADAYHRVATLLEERDFYRRDHQLIWRAMGHMIERKSPIDAVTVGEWFESQGLAEQIAGGAYLIELASTTQAQPTSRRMPKSSPTRRFVAA